MKPFLKGRDWMKRIFMLTGIGVLLASASIWAGGWRLSWSDEFDGNSLNEGNWMVRTANPGWVNSEQQRYTGGHDQANSNIFVKNGFLIIEARKSGEITSGRIESMNKKTFQYGRMESRMRLPISKGYWPAFWMLGAQGGNWPACGEIDIMEGKGAQPSWVQGAFHSSQGINLTYKSYTFPSAAGNVHDNFHTYAIEWNADTIRWYADTENYLTLLRSQHQGIPINTWPYYFILNVAVGGSFDGNSDNTTVFPESLVVDYVRVYKWDPNVDAKNGLGLKAHGANLISINPVNGAYQVHLSYRQRYSSDIFNVSGRRVATTGGIDKEFRLETSGLAPGVYTLSLKGAFGMVRKRIAVQE
jgi:beta-glucanase (GH16 family)